MFKVPLMQCGQIYFAFGSLITSYFVSKVKFKNVDYVISYIFKKRDKAQFTQHPTPSLHYLLPNCCIDDTHSIPYPK